MDLIPEAHSQTGGRIVANRSGHTRSSPETESPDMSTTRTSVEPPPTPAVLPPANPARVQQAMFSSAVCGICLLLALTVAVAHPGVTTFTTTVLVGVETGLAVMAWANHRQVRTVCAWFGQAWFVRSAPVVVAFAAGVVTVTTLGRGQSVLWPMVTFYAALVAAAAAQFAGDRT